MTRVSLVILIPAAVALSVFPSHSAAGPNIAAKIDVHLTAVTQKNACNWSGATPGCYSIVTQGTLYPPGYFAYVLVTNGDATAGIAAVQFGISYDGAPQSGVDIFSWHLCATYEFPQPSPVWPAPLSGNLITWDYMTRCQRYEPYGPGTGVVAAAGYFYLAAYTPDRLAIIPRPIDGYATVSSCAAQEDQIVPGYWPNDPTWALGVAGFARPGCKACACCDPSGCPTCVISGESAVVEGTGGHVYTAAAGSSFSTWKIGGNATITGQSAGSITVTAGPLGMGSKFWIDFDAGSSNSAYHGFKLVMIEAPVPTGSTTWSGIKTLNKGS